MTIQELGTWNAALRSIIQLHLTEREIIAPRAPTSAPSQALLQIEDGDHDLAFELRRLGLSSDFKLARFSLELSHGSDKPFIDLKSDSAGKYTRLSHGGASNSSNRFVAVHDGVNFLIETREFKRDKQGQPAPESVKRIEQLTSILHEASVSRYRILRCEEFFIKDDNFNLVFSLPPDANPTYKTLFEELSQPLKPCLDGRYILAREIASSVANFHAVGWVHKSIRSDNLLFFSETNKSSLPSSSNNKLDITKPYLAGWDYARPVSGVSSNIRLLDELDENIYRHPDQWGLPSNRFNEVHDIYALGILLYEIGTWRPARSILRTGYEDWLPHQFQKFFVYNATHARFSSVVSRRYQKIVVKCLIGEFGEDEVPMDSAGNGSLSGSMSNLGHVRSASGFSSVDTLTEFASLGFDGRRQAGVRYICREIVHELDEIVNNL